MADQPESYGIAPGGRIGTASFSPGRDLRYYLGRLWGDPPYRRMVFILLNPSRADAVTDDPTIRRCLGFAEREGCNSLVVVNLVPVIAVHPNRLAGLLHPDPEHWRWRGQANEETRGALRAGPAGPAPVVVCGWGAWGGSAALAPRAREVAALLADEGVSPLCLGLTSLGEPRHPLYQRSGTPLVPYEALA